MSVDELREYGLVRMDDGEIRSFLSSQGTGVLGLPAADAPYLLPMSYDFDGESRLYFSFVLGASSRKGELSRRAESASFLVYKADSAFNWESVLLAGTVDELSDAEWDALRDTVTNAWHPDMFDQADLSGGVSVCEFRIDDQSGIKHTGLPPGFERDARDGRSE